VKIFVVIGVDAPVYDDTDWCHFRVIIATTSKEIAEETVRKHDGWCKLEETNVGVFDMFSASIKEGAESRK